MITVTKAFLPPLAEYTRYLEEVWASGQLTNHGPLVQRLEERLRERLGAKHVLVLGNGTLALQLALRALDVQGEVITTPFSYVATTSAILWEGCAPVFADIDEHTYGIDPAKVEAAITPRSRAILATHVYGYPCDVAALKAIADRHRLRVIYDAAHSFETSLDGIPVPRFGDVSTLSFHATKLFHTVEGGALVTDDDRVARSVSLLRSFGHTGDEHVQLGINAKASELNAAMGLCMLPRVAAIVARRREICEGYDAVLVGARLRLPPKREGHNYSYYPVVFGSEGELLSARSALGDAGIGARRYFFPALNRLPYVTAPACPVAEDLSRRVLCLPLYPELADDDVARIGAVVRASLG